MPDWLFAAVVWLSAEVVVSLAEDTYVFSEGSGVVTVCAEIEEGEFQGYSATVVLTTSQGSAFETSIITYYTQAHWRCYKITYVF